MRPRLWLAAAVPVVALLVGGSAALLVGGPESAEVPTAVVRRERFSLVVDAEGFLVPVRRVPVTVPPEVQPPARIAWLAADGSAVEAGEVVIRLDPSELERDRLEAAAEVSKADLEARAREAESGSALGKLERDAEAAQLAAEIGRRFGSQDPELFSRREITESEMDSTLAERRLEHARAAREIEARRSRLEGELLALNRRQHELRLERAQGGLAAVEIRAPFDGLFVLERNWRGEVPRVGDPLWPGQRLAEIPDLSTMAAEVYVLEADAGSLLPGRPATVVVESHPDRPFAATVERVGTLAQPRQRSSPVQYFAVTLSLASTDLELMRPGQRVRAALDLAASDEALVVPRQALFERRGETIAFRRRGAGFEPVAVTLGPAGGGLAVVAAGLVEGDVVALADPEVGARGAERGAGDGSGDLVLPPPAAAAEGAREPRR